MLNKKLGVFVRDKYSWVLLLKMAFWRKLNKSVKGNAESILATVNEIAVPICHYLAESEWHQSKFWFA